MKGLLTLFMVLMLGGCGNVDWFPNNNSSSAAGSDAPDSLSFETEHVTQTVANNGIPNQSAAPGATVTGTNLAGWLVTVTDTTPGAESEFSVNGDTFSNTSRTIKTNQTLRIQHLPSKTVGGQSITTVNVGTRKATFVTITDADPP